MKEWCVNAVDCCVRFMVKGILEFTFYLFGFDKNLGQKGFLYRGVCIKMVASQSISERQAASGNVFSITPPIYHSSEKGCTKTSHCDNGALKNWKERNEGLHEKVPN